MHTNACFDIMLAQAQHVGCAGGSVLRLFVVWQRSRRRIAGAISFGQEAEKRYNAMINKSDSKRVSSKLDNVESTPGKKLRP
jgi:hypothetical protein